MPKILVTGMSGTGKSTALAGLARRGFDVVETDRGGWSEWSESESGYVWREERMYVPDPSAVLRTQAANLRSGGIVAPIEFDVGRARTIQSHFGPSDPDGHALLVGIVRSLLPTIERLGIAAAAEVEIETLEERLRVEMENAHAVFAFPELSCAWAVV